MRGTRHVLAFPLILILSALASPAYGQREVVESVTGAQIQRYLGELGFTGSELDEDEDVIVHMQGYRVLVLVGSERGKSLLIRFSVTGSNASMRLMNDWNKQKKYSRAFMDDDGDPVLESDLDLDGGVTVDRIKDFLKTFNLSLAAFLREIA